MNPAAHRRHRSLAARSRLPAWPVVPALTLALAACSAAGDSAAGDSAAGDSAAGDSAAGDSAAGDSTAGDSAATADASASGEVDAAVEAGDGDSGGAAETGPAGEVVDVLPEEVSFEPSPLVEGATSATVIGDPTGDGLYVLLGEIGEGVVFPTHTHPDDRITTVVAGTMFYSTDEEFDRDEVVAYPAGSVIYTPAGTPHTMWARDGDIVVQEAGEGPTGLELVGQDA